VKLGGRVQRDPALPAAIARAWVDAAGALVIVHGGGDEVSALQRRLGVEPAFVGGRRVTSDGDIDVLRMALSGLANKRLVSALVACGVSAVGVSGEDAALLAAEPVDAARLGRVGRPTSVNVRLLRHLTAGGYLPVVSPLARDWGSAGEQAGIGAGMAAGDAPAALNVNGDDAAAAIAVGLIGPEGADVELLLVSDVSGVRIGDATAATLDTDEALAAVADGRASGGMAAKLEAAVSALARGVPRVRIGDLAALGDPARGTVVTQAWHVAQATRPQTGAWVNHTWSAG
jgi:acetylglutamate kinase